MSTPTGYRKQPCCFRCKFSACPYPEVCYCVFDGTVCPPHNVEDDFPAEYDPRFDWMKEHDVNGEDICDAYQPRIGAGGE